MQVAINDRFVDKKSLCKSCESLCMAVQMEENMSKKALLIGILVIAIAMLFLTWAALQMFSPRM